MCCSSPPLFRAGTIICACSTAGLHSAPPGCVAANQSSKEIGKAAVQLVISLIHHNERGIPEICREVLVEGHWVDGSMLPPRSVKT